MPINGYFDTAFAVNGNLNTIPDPTQPGGTVSYNQGFPVGYSTPVASGGINVPRTAINQVLNDITTAIQLYQQTGTPPFITSTMNGGTPYSYSKYNCVIQSGVLYQSLVNSNTDTPPSAKWVICDGAGQINTTQSIAGSAHTYAAIDNNLLTLRSNSGTLMTDILPGTGTAVLLKGWQAVIVNNDASALLLLTVASGANLNGSSTGTILLGPGQRCVIFSDGSNYWAEEMPGRTRLGAATAFYVATTGSDSNNGLSSSTPFLTIQHALTWLQTNIDLNGFTATINVADGTYATFISLVGGFTGNGIVQLTGDIATPASCIISVSTANNAMTFFNTTGLQIAGFKIVTTGSGQNQISAQNGSSITINGNMEYGASIGSGLIANDNSRIYITSSYKISGSALNHFGLGASAVITVGAVTVTITGTPAFSTGFGICEGASNLNVNSTTFSGSATGPRYNAYLNGIINTNGGGATYLPGNSSGTATSGGQYA